MVQKAPLEFLMKLPATDAIADIIAGTADDSAAVVADEATNADKAKAAQCYTNLKQQCPTQCDRDAATGWRRAT